MIFCAQALPKIVRQCERLDIPVERVTLVCDKGNLSKANWRALDESSLGYVASVVPSHYTQGLSGLLELLNETRIVLRTERRAGPGRPRNRWQLEENDPAATRLYETLVSPNHTLGTTPSDT